MFKLLCSSATKYINIHQIKQSIPVVFTKLKTIPTFQNSLKKYSSTVATNSSSSSSATSAKDVLIFKYENPRYFKYLNIFAIAQFIFWNYLSYFSYTSLKDAPVSVNEQSNRTLAWWQRINLGDNKYRNGITVLCFLVGYGVLTIGWMYTLRSVRYLILCKNGNVSFVTYAPFGENRILSNVPLKCISAQESRDTAKSQLPIKIKNRKFYYILDMRGQFLNTHVFDHAIGLQRNL